MGDQSASAKQRLEVLQLAEELGNVAEACRRSGMDRTSFYQWKRRYAEHGLDGLFDLPPIHKSHPMATPDSLAETIKAVALEHPSYGCDRIEAHLLRRGLKVSSVTIQKILKAARLGSRHDRWLALDRPRQNSDPPLTAEQLAFIDDCNPSHRDRRLIGTYPGQVTCHSTFALGRISNVDSVHCHAAIDTYSSFTSAFLASSRSFVSTYDASLDLAHRLPGTRSATAQGLKVITDFPAHARHLQRRYSAHQIIRIPRTRNGFAERLKQAMVEAFIPFALERQSYDTMGQLQAVLRVWIDGYNSRRVLAGFPNYGHPPAKVIALRARKEA